MREIAESPSTVAAPSAATVTWPVSPVIGPPPTIPGYEILGELGRGGMGVVFLARQTAVQRLVALKMLLSADQNPPGFLQRFRSEAAAAARLQHPNIVQVYEYGDAGGRPFFSLEYVDGGSLADHLNGKPQPIDSAARLVATLADAMHYAHSHGVIHRDLKPGNILIPKDHGGKMTDHVVPGDSPMNPDPAWPRAKIADFGLAKLIDPTAGSDGAVPNNQAALTSTGVVLGTPSYMSPEQATGMTGALGPATDIYALGAILYECLVGRPPFSGATPFETILQVAHDDPVPPRQLRPDVPPDLETIVLKCLAKVPAKRYGTAQALGDDLRRILAREPIAARPPSPWERLRHWIRRHPARAAFAATFAGAAAVLLGLGVRYNADLRRAYQAVRAEHDRARQQLARLTLANGTRLADDGDFLWSLPWFVEALRIEGDPAREPIHRMRIAAMLRLCPTLEAAWADDAAVVSAAVHPGGEWIATARDDGAVRLWRLDSPEIAPSFLRPPQPAARERTSPGIRRPLRFDATGRRLLAHLFDGVWRFDASPGGASRSTGSLQSSAVWLPDGSIIVCDPHRIRHWSKDEDQPTDPGVTVSGSPVVCVAADAAGRRLATGHLDGTVKLWDAATMSGSDFSLKLPGAVVQIRFSPDGGRLAAAGGAVAEVWELDPPRLAFPPLHHAQTMTDVAFSPDGARIATASIDDTARLWSASDGRLIGDPLKHQSDVLRVVFSPDGRLLASCGDDNVVRVWDARRATVQCPPLPHNGSATAAVFARDGRRLVTASDDGVVKLWRIAPPIETDASASSWRPPNPSAPRRLVFDQGRYELVSADEHEFVGRFGEYRVRDRATNTWIGPGILDPSGVLSVAASPDGRRIATGGAGRYARIWEWSTGLEVVPPLPHGSRVVDVEFSRDGRMLATASEDNSARIWDAQSGMPIGPPLWHSGTVRAVRFSPDGRFVLTAGKTAQATIWETATGEEVALVSMAEPWVARALAAPTSSDAWDLPSDPRPVEELQRLAEWLSGYRVDVSGGLTPLGVRDFLRLAQNRVQDGRTRIRE